MNGYVFDHSRLGRSPKHQEHDGYSVAAQHLRGYFDGDPLAEAWRRAQGDPKLRAMLRSLATDLAQAAVQIEGTTGQEDAT